MRKNVDELFTVIIEMLQDASSLVKREVSNFEAIKCLFYAQTKYSLPNCSIYFDCDVYLSSGYIIYLISFDILYYLYAIFIYYRSLYTIYFPMLCYLVTIFVYHISSYAIYLPMLCNFVTIFVCYISLYTILSFTIFITIFMYYLHNLKYSTIT